MTGYKGYIYLIVSDEQGYGKVGYCADRPEDRLCKLQTGNPSPLRLASSIRGDRFTEGIIHDELSAYRAAGEWFSNPAMLSVVFTALETDATTKDDDTGLIAPEAAKQAVREGIADFLYGPD